MPTQHLKFPFALPFKFVPYNGSGIHFDDIWAYQQIKSFQMQHVRYHQKWKRSESTPLQIESSIAPNDLELWDINGNVVKVFEWSVLVNHISYKIYQCNFDVSDVMTDGYYFLYQKVSLLSITWESITEPIYIANNHPETISVRYKNSYNDNDVAWTTGIEMLFRFEGAIMELDPKRNNTDYINQENRPRMLKGRPYREFKLLIGDTPGVAVWVVDLLNCILACDCTIFENKRFAPKSDIEVNRRRSWPLVGASQDLLEWDNKRSLEFNNTSEIAPGIVTAYNIETGFFGPGTQVPITEIIENE